MQSANCCIVIFLRYGLGKRISKLEFPQIFGPLICVRLCTQRDKRLDADCVENLLKSGYRQGLVFRFFVTADDLFTNAEPAGEFSLRDALRDPHLRDKGRDLIQAFYIRKS